MNLARHVAVLLKHRFLAAGGICLAGVLAFLAAYQVPSLERRGSETWSSASNILVTQPGFPEGRVTLPDQAATPGATLPPTGSDDVPSGNSQRFADPQRLASLALLYADIAASEQVRKRVPGAGPGQIQAGAVDATGNGTTFLPIIGVETQAASPEEARRLNVETFAAFEQLLRSRQKANDIPLTERIRLTVLDPPSRATLVAGRSLTPSMLAFVLCCLATLALIHILEGLSLRRYPDHAGYDAGLEPERDAEISELFELPSVRRAGRLSG